jgi:hypothetical protein
MSKQSDLWAELRAELGLLPLRQHWQEKNRQKRQAQARLRATRKVADKKRAKCRCEAYPWPHRPGGGLCRWPDPPVEKWQPKREAKSRPYRERYAGILRQIARNNGLHPIRDRLLIQALMPPVVELAKQLKRQRPRAKYRNIKIIEAGPTGIGIKGVWTSFGPTM